MLFVRFGCLSFLELTFMDVSETFSENRGNFVKLLVLSQIPRIPNINLIRINY